MNAYILTYSDVLYLIYLKVALKKWTWLTGILHFYKSDHYLYSRYRWKHLRSLLHIRYVLDISKLNGPLPLSFRFFETPHWPCFYICSLCWRVKERKKGWDTKAKSCLLRDAAEQDIGETIMLDLLLHILLRKTDDCTFSLCFPPKDIKIQFGWFSQAHNTVYVWSLSIRNLPRVFQCNETQRACVSHWTQKHIHSDI